MGVLRIVVSKKEEFRSDRLFKESVVYDVEGLSEKEVERFAEGILFVDATDEYRMISSTDEFLKSIGPHHLFYALKKGQFDQRADAAEQCLGLKRIGRPVRIRAYTLVEAFTEEGAEALSRRMLNPVDTEICSLEIPEMLYREDVCDDEMGEMSSSLSDADKQLIERYFDRIGRKPTETEIKILDTYWSDHCRHTTFHTELKEIRFEDHPSNEIVREEYDAVLQMRARLGRGDRPMTLMELATLDAKYLRSTGGLSDLDVSEEINACSIRRKITDREGNLHDYLVMFKNETHNHPTEIEPFGGAATCIGGAIRDPLSGRSFVYHSMRVTGGGNPYMRPEDLLPGKLMQQDICRLAASGFSSYGNQIGLATGLVDEVYHYGYTAKRFEAGAVMGAVPFEHVVRKTPVSGDVVLLIGGRTGRDGVGGATGSSTGHTDQSLEKSGAEVQKGNAPEERKLQRLFSKKEFAEKIKRCNDFGAGGVSVAVGELAESLDIYLDRVPLKYAGLTPTEIAVSESQERMAIVVSGKDVATIRAMCDEENIESTVVADVRSNGYVTMYYGDQKVFEVERSFIDSAGAKNSAAVNIGKIPSIPKHPTEAIRFGKDEKEKKSRFFTAASSAKRGLIELFDNSVTGGTVLLPFGGKNMTSPVQVAAAKVPLFIAKEGCDSVTSTLMTYGFNPDFSVSPFHMGLYSVVESVAKMVAAGAELSSIRLSFQEFFPKMKDNWDLPFTALLGAGKAMRGFGLAAIGGKDSMSGNYRDLSVPPTLVSFAFTTEETDRILTTDLKGGNLYLAGDHDVDGLPDFEAMKLDYEQIYRFAGEGKITAAFAVGIGGVAAAVAKMGFGNEIGSSIDMEGPFEYRYGAVVIESDYELPFRKIGVSSPEKKDVTIGGESYPLKDLEAEFFGYLNHIYPYEKPSYRGLPEVSADFSAPPKSVAGSAGGSDSGIDPAIGFASDSGIRSKAAEAGVRVFVPVFPGTNSELDMIREFKALGCDVRSLVLVNKTAEELHRSIDRMREEIRKADIIALSGGFSAGDEPDGSAKFIASVFRNEELADAVHEFLDRDGLMIGICNGFQALVRLGLIPHGRITAQECVLDYNIKRKHIAKVSPVKVVCTDSPWLSLHKEGDVVMTAFSHGEGRFRMPAGAAVQVATEYMEEKFNGSDADIEGALARNGRIFGKMGHIERIGSGIYKNIPYRFETRILESGVEYCKNKKRP